MARRRSAAGYRRRSALDSLPIPENVPAGTFSEREDLHRSRQRRVEALATLAESFLATGPRDLSGSDRQQVVVHVDAETLRHSHAGRCELEQGPSIAAETATDIRITPATAVTRWTGEVLDLGLAVDRLMQRKRAEKNVSAET